MLKPKESVSFTNEAFIQNPKILWRQTAPKPIATIDYHGHWFRNTIQCCWLKDTFIEVGLEYSLGLFNSKFIGFKYNQIVSEAGRVFPQVKIGQLKKLPFVIPSNSQRSYVADRVNALLNANQITPDEKIIFEIDLAIYKVYNQLYNEIKVIDPNFSISEDEYNAIEI